VLSFAAVSRTRSEEAELVRQCLAGRDEAWDDLVRDYAPGALAAVKAALRQRGHGPDAALEDEVVADCFEELAKEDARVLRSFRGDSGLATFVSVVASRRAFRVLRDRLRHGKAVDRKAEQDLHAPRGGEVDPADQVETTERASIIVEAIAELSPADKLLLTLYYLDHRSYKEIAEATGLAATGVGTKIARARSRLRERLEKRGVALEAQDEDP
jgi:RNA polymerase sigma-70 factor (ECF subfamily)